MTMTHAYNKLYLDDAKKRLSLCFDYGINDCRIDCNNFADMFVISGYAKLFEKGNPAILAGMSGIELARKIISKVYPEKKMPEPMLKSDKSPEYWAGWALAEYQWYCGRRFTDIFQCITLSDIIGMYPIFHEMDITQFNKVMENRIQYNSRPSKLKKTRESAGISQSELARLSGVNLRSVQMYEQKVNDIDKAQAKTIYKLSIALGCEIEDLLENPVCE